MRRIEVHLPPAKFDELRDALADVGVDTMTLSEIKFVDPANRRREVYRGAAYVVDFALKVKVDLVVDDAVVPAVLRVLEESFGTGPADEVRVLLYDSVEIVHVRLGRTGDAMRLESDRASTMPEVHR